MPVCLLSTSSNTLFLPDVLSSAMLCAVETYVGVDLRRNLQHRKSQVRSRLTSHSFVYLILTPPFCVFVAVCPVRAASGSCCARLRGWRPSCCDTRGAPVSPIGLRSTCAAPTDRATARERRRAHRWRRRHLRARAGHPPLLLKRCPSRSRRSGIATPRRRLPTPANAEQSACDNQLLRQTRTKRRRSESYLKGFKKYYGCVQTAGCSRTSLLSRGCATPSHLRGPLALASKRFRCRDEGDSAT
jgi:hypothetical protein